MGKSSIRVGAMVAIGSALLIAAFAACSSSEESDSGAGPDGGPGKDGGVLPGQPEDDGGGDGSDGDAGSTASGFTIQSADVDVAANQEVVTCYYFHTSNTVDVAVKSWSSTITAGVQHMAVLFTATDRMPPGTISSTSCAMVASDANPPSWTYSTWKASDGWSFPADDGAGKPVGKPVKGQQSGYLLMHVVNPSSQPIKVRGTVEAVGYPLGTAVTEAEPYVTFNGNISVPANNTSAETNTCATPVGAKFNWMSTLSRKLSTHTYVKDGASTLFESTDFSQPGSRIDSQAPFATFATNQATVECDINNTTMGTVTSGETIDTETCMMLAYHFPATKPRLCINDILLP